MQCQHCGKRKAVLETVPEETTTEEIALSTAEELDPTSEEEPTPITTPTVIEEDASKFCK